MTTSLLDLTSEKSSLYNVNMTAERRTDMVTILFGLVFALVIYITIVVPIKMVIMALKLFR